MGASVTPQYRFEGTVLYEVLPLSSVKYPWTLMSGEVSLCGLQD